MYVVARISRALRQKFTRLEKENNSRLYLFKELDLVLLRSLHEADASVGWLPEV
jgi:hypothetical protein